MTATTLRIIKVFIASPGGLNDERQSTKRIVDEINQSHSEYWGCQIKLVGWEETLPGYRRAQALINQDLDKCQYFLGVIWNHWGSKPDDGSGEYTSGFEEEFERAKAHVENGRMKDIALFFREIPEVQLKDKGPSVTRVIEFREECLKRRKPLFKQFKELRDFEQLVRATLEQVGWREASKNFVSPEIADPDQPDRAAKPPIDLGERDDLLIDERSAAFLAELSKRSASIEATSAHEVARLRLIAATIVRGGNDEIVLGNHDANLIFVKRDELSLSDPEIGGLVRTGIAAYGNQNAPLWHWLSCRMASNRAIPGLFVAAAFGSSLVKANAIQVLQSIGQGTEVLDEYHRDSVIDAWFSDDASRLEASAAGSFLASNGGKHDLDMLYAALARPEQKYQREVANAIIGILARDDVEEALAALTKLDPDPLDDKTVSLMFSHTDALETKTLTMLTTLKSDQVRRKAVNALIERNAVEIEMARKLMTDTDAGIRLTAIKALMAMGENIPEETIALSLITSTSRGMLWRDKGGSDQTLYQAYQRDRLSELSFEELTERVKQAGVFNHIEVCALNRAHTKRNIANLRRDLDDGFEAFFQEKLRRVEQLGGLESEVYKDTKKLEMFARKRLVSDALISLTRLGDKQELPRIRKVVDQHELYFSEEPLTYFAKFGDWSDRKRIAAFVGMYESNSNGLLAIASENKSHPVAEALYAVGKNRIADLLKFEVSAEIKSRIALRMAQKDIRSLSDEVLMRELSHTDDHYRKVVALRCVQSITQTRVRNILARYVKKDGNYYYNSVFWLDLGASMDRELVKNVVKSELDKLQA